MEKFAARCRDKLTILYIHSKHPDWDLRQKIYMEENGLGKPLDVVYPNGASRSYNPYMSSEGEIEKFFEGYLDRDCVAIGFPFRNIGSQDLQARILETSCVFQHSDLVMRVRCSLLSSLLCSHAMTVLVTAGCGGPGGAGPQGGGVHGRAYP